MVRTRGQQYDEPRNEESLIGPHRQEQPQEPKNDQEIPSWAATLFQQAVDLLAQVITQNQNQNQN